MRIKKTYIGPSITLIDSTKPELGFYAWLKSRQWVIKDTKGNLFMRDFEISDNWIGEVPDTFYVGTELVNKNDYLNRINSMNLQYNNLEYYLFEIQGSCLFRDILYTINKNTQWAQSNRFLFSILDMDAIYDSTNYPISSEYARIPQWEDQFTVYMQAIKDDPIVDHNRLEMPYNISSTFWIGMTKKTIYDLLSLLKYHMPFFYKVYGNLFITALPELSENLIPVDLPASMSQYIMKDADKFTEGSTSIQGTVLVNSKIALILYSQFIRQADTRTTGLFNVLIHDDPDEFKHKVFSGNTVIDTHFVADIDKIKQTIKTRLCSFAMSSGTGYESWSRFILNFIPKNLSPEEFMTLLPCKFSNYCVSKCKYLDDVKFRLEGKEVSNIPCPLITRDLSIAESKASRDNNIIGTYYKNLTNYLAFNGTPYEVKFNAWTSEFILRSNRKLNNELVSQITKLIQVLGTEYDRFNGTKRFGLRSDLIYILSKYKSMFPNGDITSAMKGLAIDYVRQLLVTSGIEKFVISFGGDTYVENTRLDANIGDSKFDISVTGNYSIFTSGNTEKRGDHITGDEHDSTVTVICKWKGKPMNFLVDILTTKIYAHEDKLAKKCKVLLNSVGKVYTPIWIDKGESIRNQTYIASPFFNESQIDVRNRMQSGFTNVFRPDLTESSKIYDTGDSSVVKEVVKDNLKGINESDFLVYPLHTDDLGTLFEVGRSISEDKPIIKYDEKSDRYTIIFTQPKVPCVPDGYILDMSDKGNVVTLGYLSNIINNKNLKYELKGKRDNIMLSELFEHVELVNGEYITITRDKNERDS